MTLPRIVALDMDGTLIDPSGAIPDDFWPLLERAQAAGMIIAPASGRQLATLREMFSGRGVETLIAENGSVVWHQGEIVATKAMDPAVVRAILEAIDASSAAIHPVVCTPEYAYIPTGLPTSVIAEIDKYYLATKQSHALIDDTCAETAPIIKLALFAAEDAEADAAPLVSAAAPGVNYAISGKHWVDVMSDDAHKGAALSSLAATLGVDMAATAAIGDYLNDLTMLQAAGTAVAMANGHEDLKAVADIVAESNADHGAVKVIADWLQPN